MTFSGSQVACEGKKDTVEEALSLDRVLQCGVTGLKQCVDLELPVSRLHGLDLQDMNNTHLELDVRELAHC